MKPDCIFCKIVSGEIPSKKVYEDENFMGILDVNPIAEGHTLIIPKKHFTNILEMPSSLGNEFIDAVKRAAVKIMGKCRAEGFNLGINTNESAGQIVFHLHAHVVPRKKGDGIKLLQQSHDSHCMCSENDKI